MKGDRVKEYETLKGTQNISHLYLPFPTMQVEGFKKPYN